MLRSVWSRIWSLFRRRRFEADMAEEMKAHLEVLTDEYIAGGMPPTEARLAAQKRFGGIHQLQEECREQRHWAGLDPWLKDAEFVIRSLAHARGFTATVIAMLVLGIGVSALVFNLTAWILIFSQPYPHPEQLYVVGFKDKHSASNAYRPALFLKAYQEQTNIFAEYAAVTRDVANVLIDSDPVVVNLIGTSVDCFRTLGVQPVLGRGFRPDEFWTGADSVVVITHAFWQKHFGGSPDVLGRQLVVNRQSCTVIGVLAPRQAFPPYFGGDVYRPSQFDKDAQIELAPTVFIVGRLAPGVPPNEAETVLASVKLPTLPQWATAFLSEQQPMLMRLTELARPDTYWVMAAAATLLYAIACLNAMNLMLVRLLGRRRELSIRLALGGTRWQIARLVALEALALAVVASVIVAAVAHWGYPPLLALLTGEEALRYAPGLTWETGACIGALTILASISVALAPVWRLLKSDIQPVMKDGGSAGEGRGMTRFRTALVICQAAFAVVLLAGTGLMMRSFERLHRLDLGFDPVGRVKVGISFPADFQPAPESKLQLFERLEQRLATLPGVKEATFGQNTLLMGAFEGTAQVLTPAGTYQSVVGSFVSADHLSGAGMVLKKGRWLSGQPGVAESVINETMARTLFGEEDPVGRSFKLLVSGDYDHTIVGVVRDVRQALRSKPGMQVYWPAWVYPLNIDTLLLRLEHNPDQAFAGLVRRAIYQIEPKLIVNTVSTLDDIVGQGMWAERFAYKILKLLTVVALILTVVGLFSIIGYTVDSRMREFGVRLALGAQASNLHRLVMTRGLSIAAIGIVAGVGGALALTRFMETLLFETAPHDPLVYIAVAGVLLLSAALACWLPARRAAAADITTLLRGD